MAKKQKKAASNGGATVGYEAQLDHTADALGGFIHSAEYVGLGLIFFNCVYVVKLPGRRVHYLARERGGLALANDSISSGAARGVR